MTETKTLQKVVHPGKGRFGEVFCKFEFDGTRLSITGVEGPGPGGNARGGCGQIIDTVEGLKELAEGWDYALLGAFCQTWRRWHLNDMRPSCEHQRDWGKEEIEVVSYKLTSEARDIRKAAEKKASEAAVRGVVADLSSTERALLACEWYKSIHSPPDADSPLSGCYEVEKRETKLANWVTEAEHPRGVLSKPCPVCGYKYGTKWLLEAVPGEIIEFLEKLPDSKLKPAWV